MPQILLRYRYPDGRLQAALPLHIVEDRGDVVIGWLAEGTEIMYWATADGADPRTLPLDRRFHKRLGTGRRTWHGHGVLRVIPIDAEWQAIHFWNDDGGFSAWYANLESTKRRTGRVIDAVDWHLDLVVDPAGVPTWKDEDEANAAVGTPYLRPADLTAAKATGERIASDVPGWLREVGDWRAWEPPAGWGPLALPSDWDD